MPVVASAIAVNGVTSSARTIGSDETDSTPATQAAASAPGRRSGSSITAFERASIALRSANWYAPSSMNWPVSSSSRESLCVMSWNAVGFHWKRSRSIGGRSVNLRFDVFGSR